MRGEIDIFLRKSRHGRQPLYYGIQGVGRLIQMCRLSGRVPTPLKKVHGGKSGKMNQ